MEHSSLLLVSCANTQGAVIPSGQCSQNTFESVGLGRSMAWGWLWSNSPKAEDFVSSVKFAEHGEHVCRTWFAEL